MVGARRRLRMSGGLALAAIGDQRDARTSNDRKNEALSSKTKTRAAAGSSDHRPLQVSAHVEGLEDLGEEHLAMLLELRPDLAEPAPASMDELESRAFSVRSVLRALMDADNSVLQVVQILTLLGDKHVRPADVQRMAGEGTEVAVARVLEWLARRHLVTAVSDDELCVHPALISVRGAAALGPPAGEMVERLTVSDLQSVLKAIGRKVKGGRKSELVREVLAFLEDGDAVRALVAGAPAEARALAHHLSTSSQPVPLPWNLASGLYRRRDGRGAMDAVVWLVEHGLAYKDTWMSAIMPREVGLALRGGHPFPADSYCRPSVELAQLAEPHADNLEARAVEVTRAVERIVECWGSRPAPVLKSGGVGVREVRRLAADVELPERDAFRLVEIASAAGLLVEDTHRGIVLPTPAADEWLDLGLTERWWAIAHSWLYMAVHPSLAGALDTRHKAVPALAYVPDTPSTAAAQRRSVLRTVIELRHGHGDADASLALLASWDAPLAWSDLVAPAPLVVRWVLSEMELLGLTVENAPSELARALADGDFGAAHQLLANPAADAWGVVLQADLTALATGRVPPQVSAELALLADVEGRGSATVYRFGESSVRRAFDAGRTSEEILDFLRAHAAKGVPQAIEYLVGDVERRHGHMRLGRATCYVRFDDAALAAEVLRARKTAKLALRQIAPTVLVSDNPEHSVLSTLRACGYFPVQESEDGAIVQSAVAAERASLDRHRRGAHAAAAEDGADLIVPRWGLPARGADAGSGSGTDRVRALAAALAATREGGPSEPARRASVLGRQAAGVEIPTLLRRPQGEAAGDQDELFKLLATGAGFDDDFDDDSFDEDSFDEVLDEVLGEVLGGPGVGTQLGGARVERPSDIARASADILHLLQLAMEEDWLVRLSYTSGGGKTCEVTVDVLDVSHGAMLAQVAPRWSEQRYVLERIGWARVLTDVEEELVW